MKLYLVRHGEAQQYPIDAERPLSDNGIIQVERLANYLFQSGTKPIHIYHSGLLRARQTAEIIAATLDVTAIKTIADLAPTDPIESIAIKSATWEDDTILVGHLPYMRELLLCLAPTQAILGFHTATGVCLEKHDNNWLLKWVFDGSDA